MYQDEYKRWLSNVKEEDLLNELNSIKGMDEEIKDRFFLNLSFGTAGLRGVLGAGTNKMNIYTVAKATQGLADYLNEEKENAKVSISFDSRIKSDVFAQKAACVLAANGIKVYLYKELMPVPLLSFATRKYKSDAGIMVTASHNPAKYNGYKVYGDDGCQLTSVGANKVLAKINELDIFNDIKTMDFDTALKEGKIEYVSDETINEYYSWALKQLPRKEVFKKVPLKVVYTPFNGAGNVPVRHLLNEVGLKDVIIVKEQEKPDGNFPTCPYPNPEIKKAMQLGLDLVKEVKGDILIATDPDADRVGIALKDKDDYVMLSGNEVGILLTDYIIKSRIQSNTLPKDAVVVKSIVTTALAQKVAESYGVKMMNVLTGFKYIGEVIKNLEEEGKEDSFLLGFEESYGYLVGTAVRDKDAVVASLLIAEMAAYYISEGTSLLEVLNGIYKKFGYYLNKVDAYEFEGLSGMEKMKNIMANLRKENLKDLQGYKIKEIEDYLPLTKTNLTTQKQEKILLPSADILIYKLEDDHEVIIRPSGTEPKIKVYYTIKAENFEKAKRIKQEIDLFVKDILK